MNRSRATDKREKSSWSYHGGPLAEAIIAKPSSIIRSELSKDEAEAKELMRLLLLQRLHASSLKQLTAPVFFRLITSTWPR